MKKVIGPFLQLVTLRNLSERGAIKDEQLEIISGGGLLVEDGYIQEVAPFDELVKSNQKVSIDEVEGDRVGLPGLIDCHTHICFAGSRARDYAARNNGKTYQEIAKAGGGIWDTVTKTRDAGEQELRQNTSERLSLLLKRGITTVEIKSGYGLSVEDELKMLRAIQIAGANSQADVVPTCLSAHIIPREFKKEADYLEFILREILPKVREEKLAKRFDIFIEENAFTPSLSLGFLNAIKKADFSLTVHGDQFTTGGSQVAISCKASSVDHLEASGDEEVKALSQSQVTPVVLPGASIGLGLPFAPARKLLDADCSLAIASDWNPGSAPQGNLLTQASMLGTYEKLSAAEIFAGITFRAAKALKLTDRGILEAGKVADFTSFDCADYREILYHQGELQPSMTWKKGEMV